MSQIALDIIGFASFVLLWLPFFSLLITVLVILIIDMFKSEKLKKDFYNRLPYVYRQVIDSYNSQKFVFFKRYGRDCFIINSSDDFKEYETNTKKFVDEEL